MCAQERRISVKGTAEAAARRCEAAQNSLRHFFSMVRRAAPLKTHTRACRLGLRVQRNKKRGAAGKCSQHGPKRVELLARNNDGFAGPCQYSVLL